jgi:hypothetical protein
MRLALIGLLLVTAVAASPGGCGGQGAPSDPCASKACGDACHACPPDATGCVEAAVVLACDLDGKCVPPGAGRACLDPCATKACGAPCDPCVPGLPCPAVAVASFCDGAGRCLLPGRGTPCTACAGQACGTACSIDPPCYPLCLAPSLLGGCDGKGLCLPLAGLTCPTGP